MRHPFSFAAGCTLFASALLCLAQPFAAHAQTNLLTNGSFEVSPDGTVLPDGPTGADWRVVATAVSGVGSGTIRSAAASVGAVGLELVHTSGSFWFDRWETPAIPGNRPGVYMALIDAKDGGIHGGMDGLFLSTVIHNSNATYPEYGFVCDPGASFETFGVLAPVTSLAEGVDLRLSPSATADQSVFADNASVYDVTWGNRMLNPGFEYSASRLLHWRQFSATPGEFTASLTNDANTGSQAMRITRTGITADGAADNFADRVPVTPGERIKFSFTAKKTSGDAATRLAVFVPEYDGAAAYAGLQTSMWVNPAGSFERYTGYLTAGPATVSLSIGFRVGDDANGVVHVGEYVIDDVSIERTDNLMTQGDFEDQIAGNDAPSLWREPWPSSINMITSALGASEGRMGVEIISASASGFFIDRWSEPNLTAPVSKPGVYKLMVDAKDGGTHGGADSFVLSQVMHAAPYPTYSTTCEPDAVFEPFGLTAPLPADRTGIDVRITQGPTSTQSFFADNFRITDVTRSNRMINGGFENSATRLLDWRAYSLNPGEVLFSLDADAHSGARAVRIERTYAGAGDSDAGLDTFNNKIAVLPGETLNVSAWAKKLSGDADTRLALIVTEWDASNALLNTLALTLQNPSTSYGRVVVPVTTGASAVYISVAFAVLQDVTTARHVGAYLIDDVEVMRNNVPSFTGATLQYNNDSTSLKVVPTGWSDADADYERYQYQWELDGTPIVGATTPALDMSVYGTTGLVTCVVTPYDGISTGASIETAPVAVPVELSAFSIE